MTANKRVAALLTCHNRRDLTLECLAHVFNQQAERASSVEVILVDDGSTDGTAEAVRDAYPEVHIEAEDGPLFWNGGMRVAMEKALGKDFDYYWWLNDDTLLYPHALAALLDVEAEVFQRTGRSAMVGGSTQDPTSGRLTYGGVVRSSWWHPLKYRLVEPGSEPRSCDTLNGNCVLIPREVAQKVGNLDARFTHAIGDFDYAMRARRAGFEVVIAPGFVGACARNSPQGGWADRNMPLRARWRSMQGPKGLPYAEWATYARRYAGVLWPLYAALPVLRLMLSAIRRR